MPPLVGAGGVGHVPLLVGEKGVGSSIKPLGVVYEPSRFLGATSALGLHLMGK